MPPNGEYEPSPIDRVREQVEHCDAADGLEGATPNGKPVMVLIWKGAKSGKLRKMPLMRIEHNGTCAVVAYNAGAPHHPFCYRNVVANPLVELQDGAVRQTMRVREVFGRKNDEWCGSERMLPIRCSLTCRLVRAVQAARPRCSP